MVRSLRVAGMLGAFLLLLLLGSCQVLFIGMFPAALGQATARADFSARIAAAPASYFSLSTVSAGGNEYVILFTSMSFDTSQVHLLIMDPHLNVLNAYSINDLAAISAGPLLNGNCTMTDVDGFVVIGNMRFSAQPTGFTLDTSYPGVSLYAPSVSGMPSYFFNETRFRTSGSNPMTGVFLLYDEYNSAWAPTLTFVTPLGIPDPPTQNLRFQNVFTDHDSAATPDLFIFQDDSAQRTYFLRIPKLDIDGGLSVVTSAASNVFTYYGASVITKSNLSSQTVSFCRAGVIAYDQDSESLVRFTLEAPDSVSSLALKRVDRMQVAAGMSGTYCVVWDPGTRTLTRYEQWW
jgi:hypothetical protein